MRTTALSCIFVFAAAGAGASDLPKYRPATEAEIRQKLTGAGELTDKRGGFEYRPGGRIGYKISRGEICVRNARDKIDCVRITFNGEKLQMIDRLGNRETLK